MIKLHVSGKLTITPDGNKKAKKQYEVFKRRKLEAYTVAQVSELIDADEKTVYRTEYRKAIEKKSYDRNNKITDSGTVLSPSAKIRIKDLAHSLYRSGSNDFKFVTFTLPTCRQIFGGCEVFADDSFYVASFSKLLENLRSNYGLKNYLWVVERQQKNGRGAIHFHCVFDMYFISYQRMAKLWCDLLRGYHYTSKNCVDGIKINSLKGLSCYLSKYLTKNDSRFYCRTWAMSRHWSKLSKSVKCVKEITYDQYAELAEDEANIISKQVKALSHNSDLSITIYWLDCDTVFRWHFQNEYKMRSKRKILSEVIKV